MQSVPGLPLSAAFGCPRLTAKQLSNSLALTAFHMNDIGAQEEAY